MRSFDPNETPTLIDDATTETQGHSSFFRFGWLAPFGFIAPPLLFGISGFAGYIVLAFALEAQPTGTEPVLSHGQQAILISLPICTLLGVCMGTALAFLFAGQRLTSAFLLFSIAIAGWAITIV
jgi:hypothetical protein